MNILEQEDIIKGLPDQALQEEAKAPSGQVPQFLVVSEIQRRTDMRKKYQDPNKDQPQGTVADQITQEGIASVQPQQPPQKMQAYGGGMTPFMAKYAGDGVVRMATAGVVPRYPEMTNYFQSLKNNGMTRESIMERLKGQYIDYSGQASDPFTTTTDPTSIIQEGQRASGQQTDNFRLADLFRAGTPMSEAFDGVFPNDAPVVQNDVVDPNDLEPIYSMFKGVPKIEQFIANRASNPAPPPSAVRPELFDAEMPQPPVSVENVTDPRLLTLDGVNTLTPDGQRPYPPDTPSVDTLEQFSNAFKEDAERANNLLATVDDSTAIQKEAISNPVSVNLPEIRTLDEIGKNAPKSLTNKKPAFYQQKPDDSSILKRLLEDVGNSTSASINRGATYLSPSIGTVSNAVGEGASAVGEGASAVDSFMKKGILDVGEYVTGDLADSLTAGDFSSPYEAGRTISASATQPLSFLADKLGDGYQGAYNLTAGMLEPIENLGRGLVGADERQGKGFRYDTPRGLFQQDDSGKSFYFGGSDSGGSNSSNASSSEPVGTRTVLRQPVGTNTVLRKDNGMYLPQLADPNLFSNLEREEVTPEVTPEVTLDDTVISDGATSEGSGDIGVNNSNKAVNLLNNAFELDLDASKKEAFAMAMIQLGAGIAKGDLAEGLSNAGVAASGVMDKARDRSDKQLDREIQRKHYEARLNDYRLDRQSRIRRDAGASALKKYTAEVASPLNAVKFANMSQTEKDQLYDNIFQEELRVLTQAATGEDMRRGGNLAESLNEDPLGLRKT